MVAGPVVALVVIPSIVAPRPALPAVVAPLDDPPVVVPGDDAVAPIAGVLVRSAPAIGVVVDGVVAVPVVVDVLSFGSVTTPVPTSPAVGVAVAGVVWFTACAAAGSAATSETMAISTGITVMTRQRRRGAPVPDRDWPQ